MSQGCRAGCELEAQAHAQQEAQARLQAARGGQAADALERGVHKLTALLAACVQQLARRRQELAQALHVLTLGRIGLRSCRL